MRLKHQCFQQRWPRSASTESCCDHGSLYRLPWNIRALSVAHLPHQEASLLNSKFFELQYMPYDTVHAQQENEAHHHKHSGLQEPLPLHPCWRQVPPILSWWDNSPLPPKTCSRTNKVLLQGCDKDPEGTVLTEGFPWCCLLTKEASWAQQHQATSQGCCKKLGCGQDVSGHAFRRIFVTTLVNNKGVSPEEALKSGRHNSMAAQCIYMAHGVDSEMAKFRALGLVW